MRKINKQEWIVAGIAGALLIGAALLVFSARWRTEDRIMIDAISRHLENLRGLFAAGASGTNYPSVEAAQAIFAQAPKQVHTTGGLIDHFEYSTAPVGRAAPDVLVVAQVGERHFAITGSGETKELTQAEVRSQDLTKLIDAQGNRTSP